MSWRSDRVIGERRGLKRTIKLGSGETTSVYLDDRTWSKFQKLRVALGRSARELLVDIRHSSGSTLSEQVRSFIDATHKSRKR